MNTSKLLCAVSLMAVGAAHAMVIPLTATLDSQSGRYLLGDTTFSGSLDIDMATFVVQSLSLTSNGVYTATEPTGVSVAYYAGSEWAYNGWSLAVSTVVPDGSGGLIVTWHWGDTSAHSNGAGSFTYISNPTCWGNPLACLWEVGTNPGWDLATVTANLNSAFEIVSMGLETTEIRLPGLDPTVSTYSLTLGEPMALAALAAPEVPLPAAAWLFGSGLLAIAGAARRRSRLQVDRSSR